MKKPYAKRSLGQNYLVDPNHRRKIVEAARRHDTGGAVLEIGPGKGALTEGLSAFANELILVEKDAAFAADLKERFKEKAGIRVFQADFLDWDLAQLGSGPAIVVGNLPYNVSTQILIRLLQNMERFSALILMFQKEVAQRCVAVPSTKDYGILSVWVSSFARARKLFDVPPTAFKPQPKITSTVLEFSPSEVKYDAAQQKFIDFVRLIFSQRRKKISSVLRGQKNFDLSTAAKEAKIARYLDCRAEALTVGEMRELFGAYHPSSTVSLVQAPPTRSA